MALEMFTSGQLRFLGLNIRLLGAQSSGKQQLADALTNALLASDWPTGVRVTDDTQPASAGDLILLMGLDELPQGANEADQSIRAALSATAMPYAVLYGSHEERHSQALLLVHKRLTETGVTAPPSGNASSPMPKAKPWVWLCDKCSDSQCEHRLLSALLASRLTELTQEAVAGGQGG